MTLRHFKILISVVKHKSITLAAKSLFMTQPAVSLAIKEMELHYGVKLFDRLSRKLFITVEGQKVYDSALTIMKNVDDLYDQIQLGSYPNQIRIGASITFGAYYLPKILSESLSINPDINCTITNSGELIDAVLKHELDFAIVEDPLLSDRLISIPLINDQLVLVINQDNPLSQEKAISLNQLRSQAFLLREKDSGTRKIVDSVFLTHNFVVEPRMESTSTVALLEAVKHNLGVTIVSQRMIDLLKPQNTLIKPIRNVSFERPFTLIHVKNKYISPSLKELIDHFKKISLN